MAVIVEGGAIRLVGDCDVGDAEPLTAALTSALIPALRPVDLRRAGALHTAVVQALLAFRPPVIGPAADPFTARWIAPHLAGVRTDA